MGLCFTALGLKLADAAEAVVDGAEDVTDDGAEYHKYRDNDNGNQNENQRVFDQTLTFFVR